MNTKGHILAVDDDDRLRDLLKRYLTREGHDVTTAKDAASARKLMSTMSFDLVILDVMMPGEDGLSLLKSVREKKSDTPVILLTARSLPAERIEGLKIGADDYLSKPFEPEELALRISSILKRATPEAPVEELKLSGMLFHVNKGELRKDGRLVRLTESETQLLSILAGRAGAAISRHELAMLTAAGVHTQLLSGDQPRAVERIAREVGMTTYQGGCLPQDKLTTVQELVRKGRRVAMVGDGLNDAPALAAADVGMAMAARSATGHGGGVQRKNVVAALHRAPHELGAFKDLDVLGHGVERKRKIAGDLGHAGLALGQAGEDRAARGVGKGGEGVVKHHSPI